MALSRTDNHGRHGSYSGVTDHFSLAELLVNGFDISFLNPLKKSSANNMTQIAFFGDTLRPIAQRTHISQSKYMSFPISSG